MKPEALIWPKINGSAKETFIMRPLTYVMTALTVICLATACARSDENKLPADAQTILDKAEQIELLSIDPQRSDKDGPKDAFHGHKVLGKTTVKGDARKELVEAFVKGMEGKIDPAKCFNPRHGIRATHEGKTVDLVICFECAQFEVYLGTDEKAKHLLVNKSPEPAFDKVLKDAGIPKAK
jgi:hypothetical protein